MSQTNMNTVLDIIFADMEKALLSQEGNGEISSTLAEGRKSVAALFPELDFNVQIEAVNKLGYGAELCQVISDIVNAPEHQRALEKLRGMNAEGISITEEQEKTLDPHGRRMAIPALRDLVPQISIAAEETPCPMAADLLNDILVCLLYLFNVHTKEAHDEIQANYAELVNRLDCAAANALLRVKSVKRQSQFLEVIRLMRH